MCKISSGNSKIGNVYNFSFMPCITCNRYKYNTCSRYCYAINAVKHNAPAWYQWMNNTLAWELDKGLVEVYFHQIFRHNRKVIKYFRFFVGGDIPDIRFFMLMTRLALVIPATPIVVHTKKHEYADIHQTLLEHNVIDWHYNLRIFKSYWLGEEAEIDWDYPYKTLVSAHPYNTNFYLPKDKKLFVCPQNCKKCRYVCYLGDYDLIIFPLH